MAILNDSLTAIIKVTNCCNLKCKYCYIPDSAFFGNMSIQTLRKFITEVADYLNKSPSTHYFTFLWHGGEPLLMGKEFFEEIVNIQKDTLPNDRYINIVQSNLTLLDEQYCNFFKDNNFKIGTSIDGTIDIHDANRIYKNGHGSFLDVLDKLNLAKSFGLEISAMFVLNRQNINKIRDIYNFFKNQKIDIKACALTLSGQALHNYESVMISPKDYASGIIELFDMWFDDLDSSSAFINLEDLVDSIMQNHPVECCYLKNCQKHFISISPNGEVYPCSRFEGSDLCYGDIQNETFLEILQSKGRKAVIEKLDSRNEECKECEWVNICNGGCMYHGYKGKGVIKKDYYCEANKIIFKHVKSRLTTELEKAQF